MEPGSDTRVGCRGEALARCRVLGRCERGVEQGDTALPYGGCDFWAVRHVAQVAVRVDEAIAPAGGASSPEGFAFPRTSDGAPARLARSGPHALPPLRPASLPFCAASCMASAALVSSSAPTPESYRRTSPASICPIMGGHPARGAQIGALAARRAGCGRDAHGLLAGVQDTQMADAATTALLAHDARERAVHRLVHVGET